MRLLIVTQVIDTEHPILGFFHRWVEEFAKHCEHVHVICLQEGKHNLPKNVTVHSLGKEHNSNPLSSLREVDQRETLKQSRSQAPSLATTFLQKLRYIIRFYQLIWNLRREYDHVFVHMNQIYVILGAPFWRAAGKRVGLWYAHGAVSRSLQIAVMFTNFIFTSTEQGLRIDTKKRKIVGQGIDTTIFKQATKQQSDTLRLVTVGRLSQSKNIETLLKSCAELKTNAVPFHFNIIGSATTTNEETYAQRIKKLSSDLGLQNEVTWVGAVAQSSLPTHLQSADIFIHDGSTDSLDKALLEAVLCGCVVVSSNPAYQSITKMVASTLLYKPHDALALASILRHLRVQSDNERQQIMQPVYSLVHNSYNISNLISGIVSEY